MTLSIVSAVYNSRRFLKTFVDSFEKQTRKDFEILFINDGSTDDSLDVLEQVLKNASFNYRIFNHKVNYGASVARNTGLDNATGQYVGFVDSDDFVPEDYVEKILENIENDDSDLLVFGLRKVDSKGRPLRTIKLPEHEGPIDIGMYLSEVGYNIPGVNFVQIIYKRSILDKQRIRFAPGTSNGEDVEFSVKGLCFANRIRIIPDVLYNYVIHDGNISGGTAGKYNYQYWGIAQRLRAWADSRNDLSEVQRRVLAMGEGKYYKRLFTNTWKLKTKEFRVGNRAVRKALHEALRTPYIEGRIKLLFLLMLYTPLLVAAVFRLKYILAKK